MQKVLHRVSFRDFDARSFSFHRHPILELEAANRPGNFHIRPDPHPQGRLVTHGPYARVRHPMYLSVLLVAAGFAVAGDAWQRAAWIALAAVLTAKARREERALVILHPEYEEYRRRIRAICPLLL